MTTEYKVLVDTFGSGLDLTHGKVYRIEDGWFKDDVGDVREARLRDWKIYQRLLTHTSKKLLM